MKIHTDKVRMKFEFLKSHPDLPGNNELTVAFSINIEMAREVDIRPIWRPVLSCIVNHWLLMTW